MNKQESSYLSKRGLANFSCPSNIAIVKYWGKKDIQIPVNPSLSFTLKHSVTNTLIHYKYSPNQSNIDFSLVFDGKEENNFKKKLKVFLQRILDIFPWISNYYLEIKSSNTFPHSSGIASSASSYGALALCLAKIHFEITGKKLEDAEISNIARLGSGSASRSIFGGWNSWGSSFLNNSSNLYANNINEIIHSSFLDIQDTILIVRKSKKAISSTVGHQLMENHPYKEGRIKQANNNLANAIAALKKGDWKEFVVISESEALSLHGLMMSSNPGYTLLEPNSLNIVQQIRQFREQKNIPICFTIDAGPNIHVLYPNTNKIEVQEFIQCELLRYCEEGSFINDEVGLGPIEINN